MFSKGLSRPRLCSWLPLIAYVVVSLVCSKGKLEIVDLFYIKDKWHPVSYMT